jgi:hypothetical protein
MTQSNKPQLAMIEDLSSGRSWASFEAFGGFNEVMEDIQCLEQTFSSDRSCF